MEPEVVGAVLAGGLGRRVGGGKPLLEVGSKALVLRALEAVTGTGLKPVLVIAAEQAVPAEAVGVRIVRDEVENAGPLGGLHALLRWLPVEWALVVACDQPFLSPALLQELLAHPRDGADAVIGRPSDLVEPLPGLYARTCLPAVEERLERAERSVQRMLSSLEVSEVSEPALRRRDPDLLSYLNINTPGDLERARKLAGSGEV